MDRIEAVQKRFTRMTICNTTRRMNTSLSDYNTRCQMLRLETIKTRFFLADVVLIANVIANNIDSHYLLSNINFYVPSRRLRVRPPSSIPSRVTSFGQNEPLVRAFRSFNEISDRFDHNISSVQFCSLIRKSSIL